MKQLTFLFVIALLLAMDSFAQVMMVDSNFSYQFTPVKTRDHKRVLIDVYHPTIFRGRTNPYEDKAMLDIIEKDGFAVSFLKQKTLYSTLKKKGDVLIIAGIPNKEQRLSGTDVTAALFWKSPLDPDEVVGITKWVFEGGSLLLFMSHFPSGSGGKPLLEAFSVKFRDGYAYHADHPGLTPTTLCSWFTMSGSNGLIHSSHPLLSSNKDDKLRVDVVKWLCGAAVFRNPEDVILAYPDSTIVYTPEVGRNKRSISERSNQYAGMIGFEYGKGRVVVCADQGQFRNNLFKNGDRTVYVTINDPEAHNPALLVNTMRWLGRVN